MIRFLNLRREAVELLFDYITRLLDSAIDERLSFGKESASMNIW
ncbi:hypothetical protein [Geobacillus sp. BMUD]|nr:hypothetical protein [Geobacillus sp. BMUD]